MEENGPIDLLGFTPEEDAKNYALVESLLQHDDLDRALKLCPPPIHQQIQRIGDETENRVDQMLPKKGAGSSGAEQIGLHSMVQFDPEPYLF
jgi:hypothetical protein